MEKWVHNTGFTQSSNLVIRPLYQPQWTGSRSVTYRQTTTDIWIHVYDYGRKPNLHRHNKGRDQPLHHPRSDHSLKMRSQSRVNLLWKSSCALSLAVCVGCMESFIPELNPSLKDNYSTSIILGLQRLQSEHDLHENEQTNDDTSACLHSYCVYVACEQCLNRLIIKLISSAYCQVNICASVHT